MQYFLKFISFRPDPSRKLYYIHHCCVYSEKTLDDRQRKCPKHVEFYPKNKFEKILHLVGSIMRIAYNSSIRYCPVSVTTHYEHLKGFSHDTCVWVCVLPLIRRWTSGWNAYVKGWK